MDTLLLPRIQAVPGKGFSRRYNLVDHMKPFRITMTRQPVMVSCQVALFCAWRSPPKRNSRTRKLRSLFQDDQAGHDAHPPELQEVEPGPRRLASIPSV